MSASGSLAPIHTFKMASSSSSDVRSRRRASVGLESRSDVTRELSTNQSQTLTQDLRLRSRMARGRTRSSYQGDASRGRHRSPSTSRDRKVKDKPVTSDDLVCKISMPCSQGCCYCCYAHGLGPVKVFVFADRDNPAKERALTGVKDGYGRRSFPASRKADVKGLVFDPRTCAFYPPEIPRRSRSYMATRITTSPQRGPRNDVTSGATKGTGGRPL